MISFRTFLGYVPSTLKLTEKLRSVKLPLQQRIRDWVRQEIVDDDPHDDETFFPRSHQVKGH